MKKIIFFLLLFFLLGVKNTSIPNQVFGDSNFDGPKLQLTAIIDPCINITLSINSIIFNCKGAPGVYNADQPVMVTVGSNYGEWTVKCAATPLKGNAGKIPAERIFLRLSNSNSSNSDNDAGIGFEPMSGEIVVLSGSPTEHKEEAIEFKLKTLWEDRAGTYTGQINFTYLAIP